MCQLVSHHTDWQSWYLKHCTFLSTNRSDMTCFWETAIHVSLYPQGPLNFFCKDQMAGFVALQTKKKNVLHSPKIYIDLDTKNSHIWKEIHLKEMHLPNHHRNVVCWMFSDANMASAWLTTLGSSSLTATHDSIGEQGLSESDGGRR